MMFEAAFKFVVGIEGVYSSDPQDAGNWTGGKCGAGTFKGSKYGISARSYPTLDIRNLTLADAQGIYQRDFWQPLGCDALTWDAALALFDCGVNQGVGAARILWHAARQDLIEFMVARAERYLSSGLFPRDGAGWLRRLFLTTVATQKAPA